MTLPGVNAHKNQPAIEALAARGIIDGKSDGSFDPEGSMTRAEFAAIVVRALGLTPEGKNSFSDVAAEAWYAPMWGQPIPAALLPELETAGSTPAARSPARSRGNGFPCSQAVRTGDRNGQCSNPKYAGAVP